MRTSLKGHQLPETRNEALNLERQGLLKYTHCPDCNMSLTGPNVAFTAPEWRETQISGLCKHCWDALFQETP